MGKKMIQQQPHLTSTKDTKDANKQLAASNNTKKRRHQEIEIVQQHPVVRETDHELGSKDSLRYDLLGADGICQGTHEEDPVCIRPVYRYCLVCGYYYCKSCTNDDCSECQEWMSIQNQPPPVARNVKIPRKQ